ncbi:MAG: MFS transporter, partial [Bifidobacteriaceae bacterium]|nr:MFS transporter [Bifidobacteriaceae bacterium]
QFVAAGAAGVVVDRVNQRTVAVLGDVVSALAVASLPIIALTSGLSVGWFIAFGVLSAIGDVPAMTAREALVPQLARATGTRTESLVSAREALASVAVIVGPAIAGGLIAFTTPVAALWVTAVTSALAALAMLIIPSQLGQPLCSPSAHAAPLREFGHGLRYLFVEHRPLRAVTLVGVPLLGGIAALQGLALPVYFTEAGRPGSTGLTLSALAFGTLIGAGVYGVASRRARDRSFLLVGIALAVIGVWLLAALPPLAMVVVAVGLLGIGSGMVSALFGVLSLRLAHGSMQGRVLGNQNALTLGVAPFATLGVSLLIAGHGLGAGVVVTAAIITAAALYALLTPSLRHLSPEVSGVTSSTTKPVVALTPVLDYCPAAAVEPDSRLVCDPTTHPILEGR